MRAVPFDDELLMIFSPDLIPEDAPVTNAILFIVSPFFLGSCWSYSARDSLWAVVLPQSVSSRFPGFAVRR